MGALGATFGPLLLRRHEEKVAEERATREQVRASITELHLLMDKWVAAHRAKNQSEIWKLEDQIRAANVTFRLWTNGDDRPMAGLIYTVLSAPDFPSAVERSHSWLDVALEWFRGDIAGDEIEIAYDIYVAEAKKLRAEIDAERLAAKRKWWQCRRRK